MNMALQSALPLLLMGVSSVNDTPLGGIALWPTGGICKKDDQDLRVQSVTRILTFIEFPLQTLTIGFESTVSGPSGPP